MQDEDRRDDFDTGNLGGVEPQNSAPQDQWFDMLIDVMGDFPLPPELIEFAMEWIGQFSDFPIRGNNVSIDYNVFDAICWKVWNADRGVTVFFKAHHPRIIVAPIKDGKDMIPYGLLCKHKTVISQLLSYACNLTDGSVYPSA